MKRGNIFSHTFNSAKSVFTIILITLSILVVLLATLYPFNFTFTNSLSLQAIFASFNHDSFFQDQVNNVLLFMPLGFSLTNLLQKTKLKLIVKLLIVIIVGASLSLSVEVLQVFLPSRESTPEDLINNTIGGFFGFLCFYIYNPQTLTYTSEQVENSRNSESTKKITAFFAGYIFLAFIIAIFWQGTIHFSNWSLNYPLLLGNERTGNRPWQGYVYEVNIADRPITKNEVSRVFAEEKYFTTIGNSLLGSYQLNGKCCYHDQAGKLPELLWRGQPTETQVGKGVFLNSSHWLETATPVTNLNKRISEISEFTISTTVAIANPALTGPGRIISISGDPLHRNFTLGQQGTDLDLRLRTPITGENGAELKLNVPRIFADTKPHHIVITYSKASLQVYVDKLQNYYSFNLLDVMPKERRTFYFALTFIPLGFCLALITTLARRLAFYRLLLLSGIILPSLIVESILVSQSGKSFSLNSLLLGILFTGGTTLIFKMRATQLKGT